VLTAPLEHAKSVACYVMLAAGSRYEEASNRGIAHFAEHMFFKGTERRPTARDLSMEVDRMGGEFNAFTSKEYTGYYIRCAGEQRDTALDVLVDMIRNSKFDAEELEREKGVIVEEMNMYFDTPRDYVSSLYEELIFGSNPLGWETLGTKETIHATSRQTFIDTISGGTPAAHRRWLRRGWRRSDPDTRRPLGDMAGNGAAHPRRRSWTVRRSRRSACTARIRPGEHLPGVPSYPLEHGSLRAADARHRARYRMSSRLSSRCGRRGLAYYVYALNSSYTDTGTLASQAGVDLNRADEAVGVIADEFRKLADEPVPADELEKSRALVKGRFVLQTENPNGLILFGLRREVLEGRAAEPEELLAGLDAVTAEDVQRVAQDDRLERDAARGDRPFDDEDRFRARLS
jgi:predicted Zn-dependent peptidase